MTTDSESSGPRPVLTPEDVARLLRLPNARSARSFLRRHEVPCFRDGNNRVLVLLDVLLEHLRNASEA